MDAEDAIKNTLTRMKAAIFVKRTLYGEGSTEEKEAEHLHRALSLVFDTNEGKELLARALEATELPSDD